MQESWAAEHLKKQLPSNLYTHSSGVVETAAALAAALGCDTAKARIAGWLHDCARHWPPDDLLQFACEHQLTVDEYSRRQPVLLHAAVGALLAQQWGVSDRDVLNAIRNHTLGKPGMSILEQVIFLADKIEANRSYPGVEELRFYAQHDFPKALRMAVANSITYVIAKEQIVHPLSVSYWNWLVENTEKGV